MRNENCYKAPDKTRWTGRVDGYKTDELRLHQVVETVDLNDENLRILDRKVCFLGFESDEGVRRNKGRIGAAEGPSAIRSVLGNLPLHTDIDIVDVGDVVCLRGNLEEAQASLLHAVELVLGFGGNLILLGGGHETALPHFRGMSHNFGECNKLGIINVDAHFDIRKPEDSIQTSGTGFYQMFEEQECEKYDLKYLALGIQEISNTKALFETAKDEGVEYVLAKDINPENLDALTKKINDFIDSVQVFCLTIDLDAFESAIAPGVSAPAFAGLPYDYVFKRLLKQILSSPKLSSMDVSELNPKYDIDFRTARLASDIIFEYLLSLSQN